MPELPEVQTVVNTLIPHVQGKKIDSVTVHRSDVIHPAGTDLLRLLTGRTVRGIERRGKKIVISLTDGSRFFVHLGMSGRLTIDSPAAPLLPHTHAVFHIEASQVRFRDPRRFGGIWWLGTDQSHEQGLGPEPMTLTSRELAGRLGKTRRPIKNALLDQAIIAGLGNIYVDESLFEARIHPLTIATQLTKPDVRRLLRGIKSVLKRALAHRGSTLRDYHDAEGKPGDFQRLHRVYQRFGKPCPRCKKPIDRLVLGGRSTHFCATCQVYLPHKSVVVV